LKRRSATWGAGRNRIYFFGPAFVLAIAYRLNILAAPASKTESRVVLPGTGARRGNRELN
jgi:hypothetical protein